MGKLPCYKTLDEKAEFFHNGSRQINTKREFDAFWEQLIEWEDKREFRFRGCGRLVIACTPLPSGTGPKKIWRAQDWLTTILSKK